MHPLLARLLAGRGVRSAEEVDDGLARLLPPATMHQTEAAARLLADAVGQRRRIVVVADYDCDGATACAVALRGLALLGAPPGSLHFVVPDRALHGYGLTPPIARRVHERGADLLITVDNGIASVDGVAEAKALGLTVLAWTVNEPRQIADAIDLGVDGIVSDRPDLVRDEMQRRGMALPPATPVRP